MKKIILIPLLLVTIQCLSQNDKAIVSFANPVSVSVPKGYSQAAIIDMGKSRMIIISGQVALDSSGNLIGKDDMARQTEQVFTNIKNIIVSLGGDMNDVVKLGFFMIDVAQVQAVREVRNKFINIKNPPASTLVQVSKLVRDDLLIEIEATAVIPKK